jgi:hypothetical protein
MPSGYLGFVSRLSNHHLHIFCTAGLPDFIFLYQKIPIGGIFWEERHNVPLTFKNPNFVIYFGGPWNVGVFCG